MRRTVVGAAAGVALTLTAATAVSAYWQAQQQIDLRATVSGDLRVAAAWRDGQPSWPPLLPAATTPDATIRVTSQSQGTTLRWRMLISHSVNAEFQGHVTFSAWRGACGTGTPISASGVGDLPASATLDVCVRFTLAGDAPGALQCKSIAPQIVVRAEQVGS